MKQIDLCTVTVKSLCCFSVILQNFNFRAFGSKQLKGSIVNYFGVNGQHQAIGLWDKVGYRLNCSFGLQRQPRIRGRPVISERKGSAQASPIDTSCYPYFTGFEPPVSRLLRQFWVRFIPDQFKSTQGLQVHHKVFQQAGRINMAQSHSPSPERTTSQRDAGESLRQPDAQASKKDRSLERIRLLRQLKLNASTNGAFCKITGSDLTSTKPQTESLLRPPVSTSPIVFVVLETHLVSPPIGQSGGQPLFRIPIFVWMTRPGKGQDGTGRTQVSNSVKSNSCYTSVNEQAFITCFSQLGIRQKV